MKVSKTNVHIHYLIFIFYNLHDLIHLIHSFKKTIVDEGLFNSGHGGDDDGNDIHHDSDGGGGLRDSNSLHSYSRSTDIRSCIRDSRDDVRVRAF